MGVSMAIFCNRDGNLSSIHRYMKNHHQALIKVLNREDIKSVVSRSHLPILLEKVSLRAFEGLLFSFYGINLTQQERQWFAIDGKELRGSIDFGNKRGEAIVQVVSHQKRITQRQGFYSGHKESEVPLVREIIQTTGLVREKLSMDALHLKPQTLEPIHQSGGTYLVGLKLNQQELYQDCTDFIRFSKPVFSFEQNESKAKHGRKEIRTYQVYDIEQEHKDKRWNKCPINTLIEVKRDVTQVKSKVNHLETAYYVSNQKSNYVELCHAIRGHWNVEVSNHIRDVTFAEDKLKSKKKSLVEPWHQ